MKKPEVYLDMDGVIADFFAEYAKLAGIESGNYRDIPPAKVDPTLNKMVGTNFFFRLPKFPSADALVDMIVKTFGGYHICSSPLRGDHEGSEKYKTMWIRKNLKTQPKSILITPNKAKYAVQADGTPNILIDDRGSNITAWEAKGGVGIKYQADEDGLDVVLNGFRRAINIIKGEEKHEPQKLQSLDRGKMIAVQKSGDSDDEHGEQTVKEFQIPAIKTGVNVLGKDITINDVEKVARALDISPSDAASYGKTIYNIARTKIPGTAYTVADAVNLGLDVAPMFKVFKAGKLAKKGDQAGATKELGKAAAIKGATQLAKSGVSIDPNSSKSSTTGPSTTKRTKFAVGDMIKVPINGEEFKLPIIGVVPSGYLVDVSSVPGRRKGETLTVSASLGESASTASTSAGHVASLGNSPHIAGGTPTVLKRWSGSPGVTGKSVKHKPVKAQSAKDNPVTNPKVGNNLIA
jgi:5'-nucleotidase